MGLPMISHLGRGGSMSKMQHSEVEMIGALNQMEASRTAAEVGREL